MLIQIDYADFSLPEAKDLHLGEITEAPLSSCGRGKGNPSNTLSRPPSLRPQPPPQKKTPTKKLNTRIYTRKEACLYDFTLMRLYP